MSYPHYAFEVKMSPASASTANVFTAATLGQAVPASNGIVLNVVYTPTSVGAGIFAPLCVPHKIHMIGVRMGANLTDPGDLVFWKRIEGGATGWVTAAPIFNPTGIAMRMAIPTTAATGKVIYKNVTANMIVRPGEAWCVGTTAVTDVKAAIGLLVSPVWEQPANVTGMLAAAAADIGS